MSNSEEGCIYREVCPVYEMFGKGDEKSVIRSFRKRCNDHDPKKSVLYCQGEEFSKDFINLLEIESRALYELSRRLLQGVECLSKDLAKANRKIEGVLERL